MDLSLLSGQIRIILGVDADQIASRPARRQWPSAKIRAMLPILAHQVLECKEKALIWVNFPANQAYVAACLHEAGIEAEIFHSGLNG